MLSVEVPRRSISPPALILAACLASTGAALTRSPEQSNGGADRPPPSTERHEPWPLHPDPAPGSEEARCPPGAHYLFRVGGFALRLGPGLNWQATPVEPRGPTWRSDLPRCGDGRAIDVKWLYVFLATFTSLPRDCWATGAPPGPDGQACAGTPEGLRAGRRFFALGLPGEVSFYKRVELTTISGEDYRLSGRTIVRRTPIGNEAFIAPLPSGEPHGRATYRLPRAGEGAEALGPLLVECDTARWPDPVPPGQAPAAHGCRVSFHLARAGVLVTYRFPREVYDEPDWQALDLRVREWVAARTVAETPR